MTFAIHWPLNVTKRSPNKICTKTKLPTYVKAILIPVVKVNSWLMHPPPPKKKKKKKKQKKKKREKTHTHTHTHTHKQKQQHAHTHTQTKQQHTHTKTKQKAHTHKNKKNTNSKKRKQNITNKKQTNTATTTNKNSAPITLQYSRVLNTLSSVCDALSSTTTITYKNKNAPVENRADTKTSSLC